jgi:hypothetical protein
MKITMRSMMSGKDNTMDIDVTPEQIELWRSGVLIQVAMPNVPAPQREFLMTGVTPEEWDYFFGDVFEEEEDEEADAPRGWTLVEGGLEDGQIAEPQS